MNKRIRDFALESIVENISSERWVFNDKELEKFVGLIEHDLVKRILQKIPSEYSDSEYSDNDTN